MPNPLDHLYDELKVKYPDFVDRGEFVSKLSNEDELKKLHQAATQSFKGFVGFDDFKNKVGESLSTYDTDSDYRTQNTASTEQKSAEVGNTASQREESRPAPSKPQNSGTDGEDYVPVQPGQPIDTHVDAEAFDRETGDLDELGRRYEEKVKRLEGYGRESNLYVNEDEARKHYEAYARLYDEAEQDRLAYNRRVIAAKQEREEAQREEDLKSADDAKRLSAEYAGFTDKQYNEEVRRLNKERDYLNSKQSQGDPRRGERIRSYNASITALAKEGDKRKAKAETMNKRVKAVTSSPNVQKRYTSTDMLSYLFSGASPAALRNYGRALEYAKTMTPEELIQGMETIASQDNPRGNNPRTDAMLAGTFNAYLSQLSYLLGGDKPKDPTWSRYDMMSRAMGDTDEDIDFIMGVFDYLNGHEGYGTAGYQTDPEDRANVPQFAITDKFWELVEQEKSTQLERAGKTQMNGTLGDEIMKAQAMPGYSDPYAQAVVLDNQAEMLAQFNIDYDALLQKAIDSFGDKRIMEYAVSRAYVYDKTEDKSLNEVYQDIYDNTIGKVIGHYEPKNGYDFFMRQVWNTNIFSKIFQLGVRAKSGTLGKTDDYAAETAALERYAQDHQALTLGATAFNFTVTEAPFFIATGGLSSMATQTAERVLFGPAAKALSSSLWYRMGRGALASSLTGFQYGFVTDAVDRGLNEGTFDFAKTLSASLHYGRDFAVMGAGGELFGVTNNMILRSAKDGRLNRLGATTLHFMNNAGKTLANATAVTGMYAFIDKPALERENKRIEAENKKISEENKSLPKDKQKPLKPLNEVAGVKDMFWSNIAMFASLDAVHALRGMWGVARGKYDQNMHNSGIHFDKYDREALKKVFGKNPNSLLRQIVFGQVDGVPAKWFEIDPEAEQEIYQELGRELTPEEKEEYATYGFTELRKVILDDRIPWVTRAKIVTAVTGRPVGMPPVMDADLTTVMGDDGHLKSVVVRSYDAAGTLIETREFSAKQAEKATSVYESLRSSAWRNNALLSGRLVIEAIEDKTYADTVDEMAREKGISSEQFEQMVFGIKQKDITGEKVTYRERQLVEEFDKRHMEKYDAEVKLTGPDVLIEQVAREVYGEKWKASLKDVTMKSWLSMTPEDKEFIERYTDRLGRMGIAERTKLMATRPDWVKAVKEMEQSVKRNREESEVRVDESREEEEPKKDSVVVEAPTRDEDGYEDEAPEEPEPAKKEEPGQHAAAPAAEPSQKADEKPAAEEKPKAGTIGFEPVEQPTERERFDAERKEKAATITDADIEANREALGIPEGTALTDEARQIYAEDLAEDLMRYERFKRGESDEKARFHDYWESKFNPKRPKLEKPIEKQEEPAEEEELKEEEVTEADALIEQFDNLKGRSDLEKYRNALTVFAGDSEIMDILEDVEPHDITEWVSSFLGLDSGKGYSMLWESKTRGGTVIAKGFKEETGWSWNDVKGFAFMFDNKNGMSPRRVAEKIWESLPNGMKDQYSDVDVFNIMMDLFKSSSRKSDLTNYIRNNRMEQVRDLLGRRRNEELAEIARQKESERRGEEEPVAEPVAPDESSNEFATREDDVAPFSLLSLTYSREERQDGTLKSRFKARRQMETIGKILGYKVEWVVDKPYNAKIDVEGKALYINLRTDQPLAAVMGHEITHDLRKSDPKAYDALKRYAKDLLGQAQWDKEVKDVTKDYNKEYKRRGWQPISADKAEEEVVCDTMGKVLSDKKALRELALSIDPGIAGKVYRLLKDIVDKLKNKFGKEHNYDTMDSALQEFLEAVEQRAKQGIHRDPSGGYSVTDKADIESLAPRMDGESEDAYNERIAEIGADENAFVEGDGQFSLKREDKMREDSVKYFDEYHVRGNKDRKYGPLRRNSITRQALDKANEMIAEMRDYIAPWYDRESGGNRYLPEEVYGLSTIFDNASYGATLENTLICTRTLAYNDFCDSVKRKLGRPLTKRESFLASQMLYDIATDPQCLYCYVSLDRKAYDEYLLRYFDERDAVIERYNKMADKSAENIDALYKTFLDGRKDTYQMRSRFNSWLMLADHDSAIGRDKVALSSDRKNALAQESDEEAAVRWREINKQYNRLRGEEKKQFKQSKEYLDALHNYLATEQGQIKDACAYAQGASWAKKEAEYRSYTGELLRTTKRMLGGLASHYGLRFYSFSEYSPAFILENMQMVRDAALRGLKGFAYTKEIDFCKIFLPTGININCSTYGRRNAAGDIVMDERQGANWDEARALRDQYENMGIVFVATDDEMVRWAKEQPWIDVIIPFHIVRTGADIAEFYGWTNYTNVSADYDAQGRHKDIMPPEHNNSIDDYDRLIAERGLTRRFPQFYDGPGDQNYMKLINETRRKASDTPILTPVFNMEEAKKSFDKFVEKGGYWGGFYEVGADDVVRAVDEVVSDIEAGKSAGEVEYGRQDIDFDSAMSNLEKTRRRINRNREHGNVPKTSFSLKREDNQKVFDTAKRKFGETKDVREAGYVLPDGTMLDFSGRHELDPGTDSSFLAGRRTTDHRAVNQISFVYDENGDEVDTGVSSDMPDFIKRGAIRIDAHNGLINLSTKPTPEQRRVLRQLVAEHGGTVDVDFGDGWDTAHYAYYDNTNATRILGDINRYFDEGIKPKGTEQFSLKRDADEIMRGVDKAFNGRLGKKTEAYKFFSKLSKSLQKEDVEELTESYDLINFVIDNGSYPALDKSMKLALPFVKKRLDELTDGIEDMRSWGLTEGQEVTIDELDSMFKEHNNDELNAELWDKVVAKSRKFGVDSIKFKRLKGMSGVVLGGRVRYNTDFYNHPYKTDNEKSAVLLHELIHHVTGHAMTEGETRLSPAERNAVAILNDVYKIVKADPSFAGMYGITNPEEMIAEISNPEFREQLKQKKLWEKIVDGIMKLFGFERDGAEQTTAYDKVRSGLEQLLEFGDKQDYAKYAERLRNDDPQFSLKRRRNRDDYTDEDRADAAIIANTYLAQADALRQQIEADREREHQLVEERNRLLAFEYPAADPADRPAIMDRINELRGQINELRNANYENNTKLRSMDYEYRVAKEILEQGAVTDEEAARFDAGQMTREEKVLESLFKAAADSRADKKAKQKAIRGLVRELVAITDNFKAAMKARGIESQRKHYDKGTVDHIIRLAKAMMNTGYIDNMTSYEVKRLMGMINNAATRESIEEQAGRIVDMMLDHQIRTLRNDFDKQLRVTGQKTNSSGVQVQAGLDQEGQVVMDSYRKSMEIIADSAGKREEKDGELTEWGEFYNKILNDMGDADPVKAEQARKIFTGILLAERWFNDVRAMEINGRILRSQMEDFKASNKPAKDADADTKKRYNDVLADYQEMLRQNKINIIEAYERMTGDVGLTQADSMRRAKEFADEQKQRVNEIQHNANSDLADVDDNTQVKTPESRVFGANKNNVIVRLLFASAGTYEKFMRFFGRMAPNGEGYLFKRFMTQYHHARQNYWKGRHSAFEEMDKKMAEVFGKKKMHWSDIYEMTRDYKKFPPITVSYWDGYRGGQPYLRVDELNQSEALYLYMINKMPDGRMKLRKMGITDDVVQQMADQIDNKLIQLADWLQSEFLPKMRIKYNETHKRVFGADMAAIEDYFPLRINKLAVASDMDITERDMNDNKPSTITGAIVKRRVNTLPIDLHTDAFDVALSHIDEMEHWSAFAEFNRDNNTLVNYNRFRTKVNNTKSLEFGAGDVLWKNFTDAVAIATDAYHPKAGKRGGDYYSTRVAKFVSTAKIAFRKYTALKQLTSIPAFWADSDPLEQMKATVNVADTWQWAIENLPGFAERWQSRQAGNIKLANYNDLSGLRRRKTMRKLQRAGMWANAAIDGLACAMGGKAVYETKLKRYRKMGYDEARAQEKALIDAAIAYNNSQQSSEGAYVSPLQVDRTWFSNAFSVFRSASMGYTRRMNTSLRQLRNATFKPGYGAQSVEFLKKQMMRDGLTEEQAEKWAHRIYRRANLKAAASVAIFGQILPFTWNLSANMFYLLFGDDNKEKESILADSFRHSFFGPVEGLVGGNVLSELGDIAADTAIGKIWGDSIWGDSEAYKTLGYRDFTTMPLSSDIRNLLKYFARDEVKAANEVFNMLFQVATGVNPQTITDWVTAILDLSRSDMERRDIAMFAMRLLSTPQSQLDKFYLDQMNLSQEQASKMSVDDLIKRYATYKRWRETPLTGWWMYSDEREKKVEEKFQKRYEEMLEERSVAEEGLRGTINTMEDLPRKRTMMQKLQKELTDSIEATDPELYKKALEGEKADDDEYVRHVTDKDVEQMAELTMKKKALHAAHERKKQADKDRVAGRITKEEYDAIYKECAHQWKLYNYLNGDLPKKLKEMKLKMEPDAQSEHKPEYWMDSIRTLTDEALRMRPEDMKMKKADRKHYQKKNKKK